MRAEQTVTGSVLGLAMSATLGFGALGCGKGLGRRELPYEEFKPGQWRSSKGDVLRPPDAANHPWRVMMLQEEPRPKKGPRWNSIPVEKSGEIEMPRGGRFRCLYNPVVFRAIEDEGRMSVDQWDVIRGVRCSADSFRTYSQTLLLESYSPEGKLVKKSGDQAELYLSDRVDGRPLEITIVLRPD